MLWNSPYSLIGGLTKRAQKHATRGRINARVKLKTPILPHTCYVTT
jgi:hypothetical protein